MHLDIQITPKRCYEHLGTLKEGSYTGEISSRGLRQSCTPDIAKSYYNTRSGKCGIVFVQ